MSMAAPHRFRAAPAASRWLPLDDGPFRLNDLAERVRLMDTQHGPAGTSLKDASDPDEDDDSEWAELRVNASVERHPSESFRACPYKV
jgi:hypothetical protein